MVAQLAEIRCPIGRQMPVRTRGKEGIEMEVLREGANRQGSATEVRVGETPRIAVEELATRVRIVVEAETESATAAFPVGAVLGAPAHWVAVPAGTAAAAHGAAVHAARPAWALPAEAVGAAEAVGGVDE